MYFPQPVSSGILHLLCRFPVMALIVVLALGTSIAWPESNMPGECLSRVMVTFSFDDGYNSVYCKAFPVLEKYDYKGTAFIITGEVGNAGYMNIGQIKELYENGWEIGSHTITHPHLTQLTDSEIEKELKGSKAALQKAGIEVQSFSSPYGQYDEKVMALIKRYYVSHRTSWPAGLNNVPLEKGERYQLKAVSIEADTTLEEAKEWIIRAKEEQKWLILIFHRIDEEGQYSWSSEELEELVKFAVEKEVY